MVYVNYMMACLLGCLLSKYSAGPCLEKLVGNDYNCFKSCIFQKTQKLFWVDLKILMNNLYQFSGRLLLQNTEAKAKQVLGMRA